MDSGKLIAVSEVQNLVLIQHSAQFLRTKASRYLCLTSDVKRVIILEKIYLCHTVWRVFLSALLQLVLLFALKPFLLVLMPNVHLSLV